MPDAYDWESDDEARRREALRHSMFNSEIPGHSLYEGRLSPWVLVGLLVAVVVLAALALMFGDVLVAPIDGPTDPSAGPSVFRQWWIPW